VLGITARNLCTLVPGWLYKHGTTVGQNGTQNAKLRDSNNVGKTRLIRLITVCSLFRVASKARKFEKCPTTRIRQGKDVADRRYAQGPMTVTWIRKRPSKSIEAAPSTVSALLGYIHPPSHIHRLPTAHFTSTSSRYYPRAPATLPSLPSCRCRRSQLVNDPKVKPTCHRHPAISTSSLLASASAHRQV
jgi:hypothetical protein